MTREKDYFNLHILPGNERIADSNTLGRLRYIDGNTNDMKNKSYASYDKDNIVQVYVYGKSGDWAILEIVNLKKRDTNEMFKVKVEVE